MRLDTDQRLAFTPLDSEVGVALLKTVPSAVRHQHWHLLTPGGQNLVGGLASVMLLEELGPTRYVGHAFRLLKLSPVLGGADWMIAKLRPHLVHFVPHGHAPKRYP